MLSLIFVNTITRLRVKLLFLLSITCSGTLFPLICLTFLTSLEFKPLQFFALFRARAPVKPFSWIFLLTKLCLLG